MERKKRDKRRVLLMAPLVLVPLLAIGFYAMGGGRKQVDATVARGMNATLPGANLKEVEPTDKLGIYELSKDSSIKGSAMASHLGFEDPLAAKDQEEKINEKLAAINKELSRPEPAPNQNVLSKGGRVGGVSGSGASGIASDVDRLEGLMKSMQTSTGKDEEMEQLSGMMQDMLDLQYPERVRERQRKSMALNPDSAFAAIPAVVVEDQKVAAGAAVKLRLSDSVMISGVIIPKGQLLFGVCQVSNQRLLLDIRTIRLGTSIVPVDLSVYSLDGIKGIAAPTAVLGEAASQGADNAVRSVDIISGSGDVGLQAASAGIVAAKSLFSKRVRSARVKLKAGFPVLLRDNKAGKR
jgi:hypothetical protein